MDAQDGSPGLTGTGWYIDVNGRKTGPFTTEEIHGLYEDGEIPPDTQVTTEHLEGLWISVQEAVETTPKKRAPRPRGGKGDLSPGENDDFGEFDRTAFEDAAEDGAGESGEASPALEMAPARDAPVADESTQEVSSPARESVFIEAGTEAASEPHSTEIHPPMASAMDETTQELELPKAAASAPAKASDEVAAIAKPQARAERKTTASAGFTYSSGFRPPERPEGLDPPVRSHAVQKSKKKEASRAAAPAPAKAAQQPKSALAMAMAEGAAAPAPATAAAEPIVQEADETTLISELREALLVAKKKNMAAAVPAPTESTEPEDWKATLKRLSRDRRVQIGAGGGLAAIVLAGVLWAVLGKSPETVQPQAKAPPRRTVPSRFNPDQMQATPPAGAQPGGGEAPSIAAPAPGAPMPEAEPGAVGAPGAAPPPPRRVVVPPPRERYGGEPNPYDTRGDGEEHVPPPGPEPGGGIVTRMRQGRGEAPSGAAIPPPPAPAPDEADDFLEDGAEDFDPEAEGAAPLPQGAEEGPDDY